MNQHFKDTVFSINSTWAGVVADLSLTYGDLRIDAETTEATPDIDVNGGWVQIAGTSSVGTFNLYLPAQICLSILEASDPVLDIEELDGSAAALVFEHVVSKRLQQMETVLGADLAIAKIADVTRPVQEKTHGLKLTHDGNSYPAALSASGQLLEWLEIVTQQYSNPHERTLDETLVIHLGPVVVPNRQAYLARAGEMIDCGVKPSEVIKGVLMRKDGYYWPIFIEDNSIEISGALAGPVAFSDADTSQVFVTFGIGSVKLDAVNRLNLAPGSRVEIDRLPDNGANIYYQAKPFAKGNLALRGENLAVQIDSIGTFSE